MTGTGVDQLVQVPTTATTSDDKWQRLMSRPVIWIYSRSLIRGPEFGVQAPPAMIFYAHTGF
jgi:hypothetical protein